MPRSTHMTWVQAQRRWTKQYRGRTHSVSCRQLKVPDSKDASWAAANRWWEAKQAEVDAELKAAEPPPDATSQAVIGLLAAHGFKGVGDLMMARDRGLAADRLVALLRDAGEEGVASGMEAVAAGSPVLPVISPEEFRRLDAMLGPAPVEAVAGRTLREHAERWIGSLRDRVASRRMSPDRRDRYERDIRKFLEWSGPGSLVDELNAAKLDGWYSHLAGQVGDGGSTATAAHAMMTVRQMITWLAERGTIPLPGNVRSRSHVFGGTAKKVEHYSREEVKAVLAAANGHSKKTKLYALLMLNCGMYQNDIAELLQSEVDWEAGKVTRKRSKRREVEDAQEVCYPLWPETFELLQRFRSADARLALTTDEGKPLVKGWYEKGGEGGEEKFRRYDCVQSAFSTLKEKVEVRLDLKHFRKTSAQLLYENKQFRHLHLIFLAQAPRGVAARNYLDESRTPEFRKAIKWLGQQYGVEK